MDIKLDIEPEAINKYVAEQLLNSVIGVKLREAIESGIADMMKTPGYGRENALQSIVSAHIRTTLHEIIVADYGDKIRAMVAEQLTDEFVTDVTRRSWDAFMKKLDSF